MPNMYAPSIFITAVEFTTLTSTGLSQLQDGRYEKSKAGIGNVHSFHTRVGDIKSFFADNFADTLELVELRSQEGILGGSLDAALSKSEPQVIQAWADLMYEKYSTGEEHLGCADHLVAVLKKKT